MVLFQRAKLITLDQPLSPRVQLLSMELLHKSLPFTTIFKKWRQEKQNRTCPKYKTIFVPEQCSVYLFVFTYSYFLFPSVGLQYVSQAQVVYARMIKTECCRNTPILFSRLCPMASKRQTFCILDVKDKERSPTSNVLQ